MYIVAVLLCWVKCGLDVLPLSSVLSVAHYLDRKLQLYAHIFVRNEKTEWIRTDRSDSARDPQEGSK
jgi:hypothetical protein